MDIYNWRFIRTEDDESMIIVNRRYTMSTYTGIDIERFIKFKLYDVDDLRSQKFSFSTYVACGPCRGAGKFNWIDNIVGPVHFDYQPPFIRDKNKLIITRNNLNGKNPINAIWAPVELNSEERICEECLGSGLSIYSHIVRDNLITCSIDKVIDLFNC